MEEQLQQESQLELPDLSADLGGEQANTELNIDPESGLPDLSLDSEFQEEITDNTYTNDIGLPESPTARVIADNTPGLEDFDTNSPNFPSQLDITGDNTTNNEVIKLSDEMFQNGSIENYQDIQDLTNIKLPNTLGDNFVRGNNIEDTNNEIADSIDNSWLTEYDDTSTMEALGEDSNSMTLDEALGKESHLAAQLLDSTPPSPNDPEPTTQPTKKNADSWLKRISWYEVAPEKRKDFDEDLTALATKFMITKFTDAQYGWDDFSEDFDKQAKAIYGDDYWKTFTASTAKEIAVDGAIYMGILALASTGVGAPLAFGALAAKNGALAARIYTGVRAAFLRSAIVGVAGGGTQQILNKINGQEKSLEDEIITRAVGNLFGEGFVTGGRFAYTGAKSIIKQKGFNFSDLQNAISEEFAKTYQFPKHKKNKEAKPVVQALLDNGAGSPATSNVIDTVAKDIVENGGNSSTLTKNLTGLNDLDVMLLNPTLVKPEVPVIKPIVHRSSAFEGLSKDYPKTKLGSNEAARDIVLGAGKEHNYEFVAVLDRDGNALDLSTSKSSHSVTPTDIPELKDPTANLVLHHNHPTTNSRSGGRSASDLSPGDINSLAIYRGVETIVAHTDSTFSAASLTGSVRSKLLSLPQEEADDIMKTITAKARYSVQTDLDNLYNSKVITLNQYYDLYLHSFLRGLEGAGVIKYSSDLEAGVQRDILEPVINNVIDRVTTYLTNKGINYEQVPFDRLSTPLSKEGRMEDFLKRHGEFKTKNEGSFGSIDRSKETSIISPDAPLGNAVIANTIIKNQQAQGLEPHVSMQLDANGQWVFRKDLFTPIDRSIAGKGLNTFVTFGGVFDSVSNKLPALSATLNDAELATIAFKKSAISKLKQATKGLKRDETALLDEVLLRGDEMETVFDSAQLKTLMGDKYTPELETAYRSMRQAITEFGEAADKAIVKDLMDKGFRNLEIDGNVELVLPIKKVDDLRTRVYKTQELNAYGKSSNVLKEEIVFTADIKPIKNAIEFRNGYVPVKYEDTVNLVSVNKKTGETKLVSKYRTPAAAKEAAQKLKTTPNELFNPEENVDLIVQLDQISLPGMSRDSFLQLPDEVLETMYKNIENVLPEGTKLDKGSIKAWIELTSMRKLQKKAITGERGERVKTTTKDLQVINAPRKNTWESIANYIDQVSVLQGKPFKLEITNQFESKYADVLRGKAWDSNIDIASFSSKAMQDKAREAKSYQKIIRTAFSGQSDNARILSARENARFNEIMTSSDEDMTYFRKVMQKMAPDLVRPDTASVGRKFSLTTSNLYVRYNFQQFTVNLAQPLMALGARGVRLDKSAKALAQTVKFADGFLKRTYGSRRSAEQEQLWDEIVTSGYLSRADQDRIFKVLDGSRSAKATEVLDNTLGFAFDATEAFSKVLTYNLERNDLISAIKKGTAIGLKGQKLTTADIGGKEFQQIVRQKALVFAIDNSKANFTPASVGGILPTTFYEKAPLGVAKAGYLIDRNVGQFMSTSFKIAQNTYFQIPAKQRAGAIAAGMVTFGWSAIPMMGDLFTAVDKTITATSTQTRPNPASNLVKESAQWVLDSGEEAIQFIPGIDEEQAKNIKKLAEDITVGRGLLAERAGVDLVTRMTLGKFLSSFANKSDPWDYLAAYSVAEKTIESGGNFVDFMYNLYGAHLAGEQAAARDLTGSRDTFLRGLPFPVLTQYMNKKIAEDWDTYGQGEVFDKQYFRDGEQVVPERSTGNFAIPTPVDKRTNLNLLLGSRKTETQKNFSNMEKSMQWKQFLDRELKDWDVKLRTNVLTEKQREDTKKDYAQWTRDVINNMIHDGVSPVTYISAKKDMSLLVTKAYNKLIVNKSPVLQPMTEEDKLQAIQANENTVDSIMNQSQDKVKIGE